MRLPIHPEVSPTDLGSLVLEKQQVVLQQLLERLKVIHAQAALKQQQADLGNDGQFNPTSDNTFTEGDIVMSSLSLSLSHFCLNLHHSLPHFRLLFYLILCRCLKF